MTSCASPERWRRGLARGVAGAVLALVLAACGRQAADPAAAAGPPATAPGAEQAAADVPRGGADGVGSSTAGPADAVEIVRRAVAERLGQPVTVEVDELRSDGRWTFLTGVPRTPAGDPLDYAATPYAQDVADGLFDDWLCALLARAADGWSLVALEIGATDAPFADWPERHGVPPELIAPVPPED